MQEDMPTIETLSLCAEAPGTLRKAVDILRRGELVAFPTDTVYGVGAHAMLSAAVEQLYVAKGRPSHRPIPLLLSDAAAMEAVCADIPDLAWRIAERFWPGGLSVVLHRATTVPDAVTSGGATVAIRVPDHSLVRELCRKLGVPLAATSANRHGRPPPVTAGGVLESLGGRIPLVLDGGLCPGGMASTVLDLTVSPPVILRQGPVTADLLAEAVSLRT
jgi:L-threonylcarbamoyladenylate synthase